MSHLKHTSNTEIGQLQKAGRCTYLEDVNIDSWAFIDNTGEKLHHCRPGEPRYHQLGKCETCKEGMPPGIEMLLRMEASFGNV